MTNSPEHQQPPRLSILHVLLWCFASAILMSRVQKEALWTDPAGYIVFAICTGGTIAVSISLLWYVTKRIHTEPGYWLAIASLLDGFLLFRSEASFLGGFGFGEAPKVLILLASVAFSTVQTGWTWSWRLAVLLMGVRLVATNFPITTSEFIPFSLFEGQGWSNSLYRRFCICVECFAVFATLFAIAVDLWRKLYRDWLHWVGMLYCVVLWFELLQIYVVPLVLPDPSEVPSMMPTNNPFGD